MSHEWRLEITSSTGWVPGIELRLSGLVEGTFAP